MPLTNISRKVSITAALALILVLASFGESVSSAEREEPPEGARAFAEQFFYGLVEEIVFTDRKGDWGFAEERGEIAFSELYPIYSLNADFALGTSKELIADRQPVWVAVIFQDGRPVNAIGTRQADGGGFELDALGYPPELPHGLLNLKEGETVLHVPPADAYYVYSRTDGTLARIGLEDGQYRPGNPLTAEQFRNELKERFFRGDEREKRLDVKYAVISAVFLILLFGAAYVYFGRRTKALR